MSSIQTVSLPEFSRLQDHPNELKASVITCIRISSAMTLPALAGLAAVSYPLMSLLGPSWLPAAEPLKLLCIGGMGAVFTYFTGPLLQALGRPHHVAALTWLRTVMGCMIVFASGWLAESRSAETQVISIAAARVLLIAAFDVPVYIWFLLRTAKVTGREFTVAAMPSVVSALTISLVLFAASSYFSVDGPLPLLALEVPIGGIAGIGALAVIDKQLREIIASVGKWICSYV